MGADLKVFRLSPTGTLILGVSRPPEYVEGIDKLVQIVVLALLVNPGRSIFNPGKGGGIRSLIGYNVNPDEPEELFADVRLMIELTRSYVAQSQLNTSRPPSELLRDLQLIDIVLNDDSDQVEILLAVINEEQDVGQVLVPIV